MANAAESCKTTVFVLYGKENFGGNRECLRIRRICTAVRWSNTYRNANDLSSLFWFVAAESRDEDDGPLEAVCRQECGRLRRLFVEKTSGRENSMEQTPTSPVRNAIVDERGHVAATGISYSRRGLL